MTPTVKETDPLDHLEERIQRAVALVNRLRDEKADATEAAAREKESSERTMDALRVDLEEAQNANARLTTELEAMRTERLQVRSRLEKLLGHIDQLGSA
jgi:FtsZ-binding cell division protein ZapB